MHVVLMSLFPFLFEINFQKKCIENPDGSREVRPLNILDLFERNTKPKWLDCTEDQNGREGIIPASCTIPDFNWEDVYDDYNIIE